MLYSVLEFSFLSVVPVYITNHKLVIISSCFRDFTRQGGYDDAIADRPATAVGNVPLHP